MALLKFHFEKLLADIKTGVGLAPADQESNDLFRDKMDQIEDRWIQYDAVQGEVYGGIPIDRQAEAISWMEQSDDLRSRIVRLRSAERKKRDREWIQPSPCPVLDRAEGGDRKEETAGDPAGGDWLLPIKLFKIEFHTSWRKYSNKTRPFGLNNSC